MRIFYCFAILLCSFQVAFSQSNSSQAYVALADSLYQYHNYQHAALYYQKALKKNINAGDIMLHVARCYSKINNIQEAEQWYRKAETNHATFLNADVYQYVHVLMMMQKRNEAEALLMEHIKKDPDALFAQKMFDDLKNFKKYYKDSLAYQVTPLSINTPQSEFAPAFYKEGIVFSSAQQRSFMKRKYHWDNSHFLNLYFSKKVDQNVFSKPVLFEDKLNARFHDGPATFYKNGEKMILTRNQLVPAAGQKNSFIWHLALYDAQSTQDKEKWKLTLLPFNEPAASLAHPSISEDGTVLYFISDKIGGYGGTDIYRVVNTNGQWGVPFNLGPSINTAGNEVFPFFINNTLYFASNGHGGLGGLDIFSSQQTVNGFASPVNLGYPINSNLDDFSLITTSDERSGYFASARNGSDDLFSFNKRIDKIKMLAHIFDGKTKENLSGAEIHLITDTDNDTTMLSDEGGLIHFQLPAESTYIIIGSKDSKTGMLSGIVLYDQDETHTTHQISAFGDTTHVPYVVVIKGEDGFAKTSYSIIITDETTGKVVQNSGDHPMISFLGTKGHDYKIEIKNELGDTTIHQFKVQPHEEGAKTIEMILKDVTRVMNLAARVFNDKDQKLIQGAEIKIITFSEPDQDLLTNAEGIVEFNLPVGSAYMVMASKDALTGMHSGVAETGGDKASIIHSIPMRSDPDKHLPLVLLITNDNGEILDEAKAIVTNKVTGEQLALEMKDGVLTFMAEQGNEYAITVSRKNHQPVSTEVRIQANEIEPKKITVALVKDKPLMYQMAARVMKSTDKLPLANAEVKIVTFDGDDISVVTNEEGLVEFTLPEGTAYMITATKDTFTGMHSGIVESGTDKASIIHSITAQSDPEKQLPIVSFITDKDGVMLNDAQVNVTEKTTGKKMPAKLIDGILSFYGEKGKAYTISVEDKGHRASSTAVSVPMNATEIEKINIALAERKPSPPVLYHMAARVIKAVDKLPLGGALVKIMTFEEDDRDLIANEDGVIDFRLTEGTSYIITATKDGLSGMLSGIVVPGSEKGLMIHSIEAQGDPEKQLPIVSFITNKEGELLNDAHVVVTDKTTGQKMPMNFLEGVLSFYGEKGKDYNISVADQDLSPVLKQVSVPMQATEVDKINITLAQPGSMKSVPYQMAARIFRSTDKSPLANAQVKIVTFETDDINLVANEAGIVDFTLPEGTAYIVTATKDGFSGMHSGIVEPGTDKASIIHPIAAQNDPEKKLPIVSFVTDKHGDMLDDAKVHVTERATGQITPATFKEGVLSFYGDKGKEYNITVEDKGHRSASTKVSIPEHATEVEKINIALAEKKIVSSIVYTMAVRVVKAADQALLSGARVKIITFEADDKELVANEEGVVFFTLPEGAAYVAMASSNGFSGMHSGIAEAGTDKASVTHTIAAHPDVKNKVPIVGLISTYNNQTLDSTKVRVVDETSGEKIDITQQQGLITFMGEQGHIYNVEHGQTNLSKQAQRIVVDKSEAKPIQWQLQLNNVTDLTESLVISSNLAKTSHYFLVRQQNNFEIIEEEGVLYLKNEAGKNVLCKGTLAQLEENPKDFIRSNNLRTSEIVRIENIYFDFDKAILDDDDKEELGKIAMLLNANPSWKLKISTHTDDRGGENYNKNLSERRGVAITKHLSKLNISKQRLVVKSFGEEAPAVPCVTVLCSENDYQKNRRAEFDLLINNESLAIDKNETTIAIENPHNLDSLNNNSKINYKSTLELWGKKQIEGLIFKINIGAYRHNPSLEFPMLKDLGTTERNVINKITYYLLGDFQTLSMAEEIRKKVIERGINDASISIYYQNQKISLDTMKALFQ